MRGELTRAAIPVVVFILMAVVGTGLRATDFRRVVGYPRAVILGTLGQTVLVPVLAVLLVAGLAIAPETATAMLILALCPGGILSNFYCALANLNVALSITLTAISSLVCIVTIPLVGGSLIAVAEGRIALGAVPLGVIVTQLLLFLLLPLAIGMVLRRVFSEAVAGAQKRLHALGLVLIVLVVLLAMWEERDVLLQSLVATALPAVIFTFAALALGYGISVISGIGERAVIAIELSVRNVPIAILIGTALEQPAMLSFSLAYFLLNVPIVLVYAMLNRRSGGGASPAA